MIVVPLPECRRGRCGTNSGRGAWMPEVAIQNLTSGTNAKTGLRFPLPTRCTGRSRSRSQRWAVRTPRSRNCAISFQELSTSAFGLSVGYHDSSLPRCFALVTPSPPLPVQFLKCWSRLRLHTGSTRYHAPAFNALTKIFPGPLSSATRSQSLKSRNDG